MQREVVRILKKWLDIDCDDYQTEIAWWTTFNILSGGGLSSLRLSNYDLPCPPPEEWLIRSLARELIATIRGIDDVDLIVIPDKERTVRFIRDILPKVFDSEKEEIEYAEMHANYLVEWLREIYAKTWWRGKRIEG